MFPQIGTFLPSCAVTSHNPEPQYPRLFNQLSVTGPRAESLLIWIIYPGRSARNLSIFRIIIRWSPVTAAADLVPSPSWNSALRPFLIRSSFIKYCLSLNFAIPIFFKQLFYLWTLHWKLSWLCNKEMAWKGLTLQTDSFRRSANLFNTKVL